MATDPSRDEGGPSRKGGDRSAHGAHEAPHELRGEELRRTLGFAYWPLFVWRRVPPARRAGPQALLSILHTGYVFSAMVLVIDAYLWLGLGLSEGAVFLLGHLLWISVFTSLILLNGRFLEHLDGTPLVRLGWANRLTVARVFLLPILLYLLVERRWGAALAGYVVLGLTDVADGMVARRRREESKIGFVLDPFGDILFHLGILGALTLAGVLSRLTGTLVAARYLLLLTGCGLLYASKGEIWIQPTPYGKATGLVIASLTALVLLILGTAGPAEPVLRIIDRVLSLLFAAGVIHVIVIGWINFRRPPQGGTAVYRRGWGLLLGRRAEQAAADREPKPKEQG